MNAYLPSLALLSVLFMAGCASRFPTMDERVPFPDGLTAEAIFSRSLEAHGGDLRADPGDINLCMTGEWGRAIQRIQPIVTDASFRISAEERYRPSDQLYAARHEGPAGVKTVIREEGMLRVFYNGEPEEDPVKLRATAMTTDAFELFHFGPTFIKHRAASLNRLPDAQESGQNFHRLLATIRPGFGEAEEDQVVLWIHPETHLLYRVHLTLNGFETTQGAHVDVTFLDYAEIGSYTLPVKFDERVRGPIRLSAHQWETTGLDRNRGWSKADVDGPDFRGAAEAPARPFPRP